MPSRRNQTNPNRYRADDEPQVYAKASRTFVAKYPGTCVVCTGAYVVGERVHYVGSRMVAHAWCELSVVPELKVIGSSKPVEQ